MCDCSARVELFGFETGYYFIVGVKAGVEAGIDGNASEASQKKLMNMKYISLLPEHLSGLGDNGLFQDSVYNEGVVNMYRSLSTR